MDVSTAPRPSSAPPATPASPAPARSAAAAAAPNAGARRTPFSGILASSRARSAPAKGPRLGVAADAPSAPSAGAGGGHGPAAQGEQGSPGGRGDGERGGEGDEPAHPSVHDDAGRELDLLDPAVRQAASLAPPPASLATATSMTSDAPLRSRSLEELLPALVRRIAWAGDKHKGTVRLELGAGAYAGTTVIVHADGGRVRVEISGAEGPELDRLRVRLDGRLRDHGLDVESVT